MFSIDEFPVCCRLGMKLGRLSDLRWLRLRWETSNHYLDELGVCDMWFESEYPDKKKRESKERVSGGYRQSNISFA